MPGTNGHKPAFKIPPIRVPADRCPTQTTTGEEVFLHAGEWVEFLPLMDFRAMVAVDRLSEAAAAEAAYAELCGLLSRRVTAWSLTDVAGDPLPQPWRDPDAIRSLDAAETTWLLVMLRTGGGDEARKNGSGPSADTTSPAAPSPRKR